MRRGLAALAGLPLMPLCGGAALLLGAGAVLVAGSFDSVSEARLTGGDVPVNAGAANRADITSHNSPTIARNPIAAGNLVVSNRIDTPRFGCALRASFDGGASWSETRIPIPRPEQPKCFAPDLAFASDGTLYLSFVTLAGKGNVPHAAWVASSTDGGRTLSEPRRVLGPLAFQVRLAVDAARPGRVYLTWLQGTDVGVLKFTGPGNPIRSARSEDGGRTWSRPVRVSSRARGRAVTPSPAVGPKGELYVLYVDLGQDRLDYEGGHRGEGGRPYPGHFKLVLARSLDRGKSWEESVADDGILPIGRFIVFFPPFPSIAVDQRSGRVYAAFHDRRLGDPDVFVWSLASGGTTWEGPTRVNDTRKRDGRRQYLPELAVAPNGRVDAVYYDRRGDPGDLYNHVSLQSSFDHARHFSPAIRLTSRPFDSSVGFGSPHDLPDLGSRLGLISDDRWALPVWTDTRSGTRATNKQDLYRALAVFSRPARLSKPVMYALRYGGVALALLGLALLYRSWRDAGRPSPPRDRRAPSP